MTRGPVTTLAHWVRVIAAQKRLSLWLLGLALAGGLVMMEFDRLGLVYLVLFGFAASVVTRWLVWIEENRFTPRGLRVGISWALLGVDPDTDEFDPGAVLVYFVLLMVLFVGLLVKPVFDWMF